MNTLQVQSESGVAASPVAAAATPLPSQREAAATSAAPAGDNPSQSNARKGGAQKGNLNRYRHGLRQTGACGDRRILVLPTSPARDRWADRLVDALRRKWEQAVIEQKGELARADEEAIQTAAKWELHSIRAGTWLRRDHDKMTTAERIAASREMAEASERRDKALAKLGIDGMATTEADHIAAYFAKASSATPQAPVANNASESNLVAHTGNPQEPQP